MADEAKAIQLGAGRVTVINVGDSFAALTTWVDLPEDRAAPYDDAFFQTPTKMVQNCILVRFGGTVVLVDASLENGKASLVEQLAAAGVRPEDVGHVVITHGHWDHFNATTIEHDSRWEPVFPNATYYLGQGDWDDSHESLQSPTSLESHTLGILRDRGQLELVEGNRELGPGIQIIVSPGETSGHQIVRFHDGGQTLYCLGDLYHHPVEAARPHWMVRWANPSTNVPSRAALAEAALAENAMLVATHIPGIGRLRPDGSGLVWEGVEAG